jgi:hypothetical protein
VLNYDTENQRILFSVRNRIKTGDCLEILLPENIVAIKIISITDRNGNNLSEAHSGSEIFVPFEHEIQIGVLPVSKSQIIHNNLKSLV